MISGCGTLFIEAFRFDPGRFDAHGQRTEHRHAATGTHTVHSRHDPARKTIIITHVLGDENGRTGEYEVTQPRMQPHTADQAGLTAWMRSTVPALSRSVSTIWNPAATTRGSWRRVKYSPAARTVKRSASHWAA